jgi:hypothetical protein
MEVFIGYDSPHPHAFATAAQSVREQNGPSALIRGLHLDHLQRDGIYRRPTERRDGKLWDVISEAPMATEFAVSRFLIQELGTHSVSLFMDCDMLVRAKMRLLFEMAAEHSDIALWCVKHPQIEESGAKKMDGQTQTYYGRKNWSSFMLINRRHPANEWLTVENVNSVPGRDLHGFCWLKDTEIGTLEPRWNWLVGLQPEPYKPANIHWTLGGPWLPEFADAPFADEWRETYSRWVGQPI